MGSRVQLFDDLDSSVTEDVETVVFGYKGKQYEIDLGLENRVELDELLTKFVEAAQEVEAKAAPRRRLTIASSTNDDGTPARTKGRAPSPTALRNQRIRVWARAQGHDVKDGGRLKADLIREYEQANPEDTLSVEDEAQE